MSIKLKPNFLKCGFFFCGLILDYPKNPTNKQESFSGFNDKKYGFLIFI